MQFQKDIRPVDRVPCEPGMWVTPLNITMAPLGDEFLPPLDPIMISATYEVAKILKKMNRSAGHVK